MDKLRLSIEIDLPDDLFERSKLIAAVGEPVGVLRAALETTVQPQVPIRYEIVPALPEEPAALPRRRRRTNAEIEAAKSHNRKE